MDLIIVPLLFVCMILLLVATAFAVITAIEATEWYEVLLSGLFGFCLVYSWWMWNYLLEVWT